MNNENATMEHEPKTERSSILKYILIFFKISLPLAIIIVGGLGARYLLETKPKSKRLPPVRQAKLVECISIDPSSVPIKIDAMGTIMAAQVVNLTPQVSGKIIELSPELVSGGTFKTNQILMKIEPDDYELLVQQAETQVAIAKSNLRLEQGNQAIAEQEYKLLGGVVSESDKELLLRNPQLISAQSTLQAAQARLQQAKMDLSRTHIAAPFNAVVKSKNIELGAKVLPSTSLVTLIGTDEYWAVVMVHVEQLQWITIPSRDGQTGSEVKIYNDAAWGAGIYRTGRVIRLRPDLEKEGRMAQLLISIKDPLSLNTSRENAHQVLVGSYVRVEIQGNTIDSAYILDRDLLHDDNNVRLLNTNNTLDIRPIEVAYRGSNEVVVSGGINADDKIIITELAAPVQGMSLKLRSKETRRKSPVDKDIQVSLNPGTK